MCSALVLGELEHYPHTGAMIPRHKLQQVLVINRAHMCVRQAFDRVRLALKQNALDAHQIAGQENDDNLPTAVLDQAGPRDPPGFQQVDRSALLAGVDQDLSLTPPDGW